MNIYSREFEERLQHYRQQIRKDQIQQVKAHVRMTLIHQYTLAQVQKLVPSSAGNLSILELFQRCRSILMDPFEESSGALESIPLDWHVSFWQKYVSYVSGNVGISYCAIPQLVQFVLKFQKRHPWSSISPHTSYAQTMAQVVEMLFSDLDDGQKETLAEWMTDIRQLKLVYRFYSSAQMFPRPKNAPNLYHLINQGLKRQELRHQVQAAQVMLDIAKYANPQQLYLLHKEQPQIMKQLLILLQINANKPQSIHFWPTVYYLIQTHSFRMSQIIQQGVVRVCGILIGSELESSIFGALSLLKLLTGAEDENVVQAVIGDQQMGQDKTWLKTCIDKQVYLHQKLNIRRLFFQILRQVLFRWKRELLQSCLHSCKLTPEIFFDMIQPVWQSSHRDEQTVQATLECVWWLLKHYQLLGMVSLQCRGMMQFVQKCCESSCQEVQEISSSILEECSKGNWGQLDIEL